MFGRGGQKYFKASPEVSSAKLPKVRKPVQKPVRKAVAMFFNLYFEASEGREQHRPTSNRWRGDGGAATTVPARTAVEEKGEEAEVWERRKGRSPR